MSVPWALNMAGFPLSEKSLENVPHPRTELVLHVTTKTCQAGAFLGTLIVGPTIAAFSGNRTQENFKSWSQTCGSYGVLLGLVAGPWMTNKMVFSKGSSEDAVVDRCYRLRFNRNQLRVDRLSCIGLMAGYGAATYLGEQAALGALVGVSGGLLLGGIFNTLF